MNIKILLMISIVVLTGACGGSGGSSTTNNQNQQNLINEIDRLFPFTANQPIDVTFTCALRTSVLVHYFDFNPDMTFDVYVTLDTGQDIMFSGTYSYENDQLTIVSGSPLLNLNETTTRIESFLGMVGVFESPNLICAAYGHGYNDPVVAAGVSYLCPYINIGPASQDENVLEFVLPAGLPFNLAVPGSIFRQKDVIVNGMQNPIITRGYGIYRRVGDIFYGYFGNQFNDVNLLKGMFLNNDAAISVEQLDPAAGNCLRR